MAKWKQPAMGTQIKAIRETKIRIIGKTATMQVTEGTRAKLRHIIGEDQRTAGESIVVRIEGDNQISCVGDIKDWTTVRGASLYLLAENEPKLA